MRGTRETRRERRGVVMRAGASTLMMKKMMKMMMMMMMMMKMISSRRKTLAFALAVMSTATLAPARARTVEQSTIHLWWTWTRIVRGARAKCEDAQRVRDARDDAEADAPSTTLPNGLRYREYVAGEVGEEAMKGSRVDARYKVFRLSARVL